MTQPARRNLLLDEDGPTATEYAVLLALIIAAVIVAINAVGNSTTGIWSNDMSQISSATGGGS